MKKILTSPSSFGKIDSEPFDLLSSKGYGIINNPYGRKLTKDEDHFKKANYNFVGLPYLFFLFDPLNIKIIKK